jgi:hypothetical protein
VSMNQVEARDAFRFVAMEAVLTSVSTCKMVGPHATEGEAEQEAKFVTTSSTCMCMTQQVGLVLFFISCFQSLIKF